MSETRYYFCLRCNDRTRVRQCVSCRLLDSGNYYRSSDHLRCCKRRCDRCRSVKVEVRRAELVQTVWGEMEMEAKQ